MKKLKQIVSMAVIIAIFATITACDGLSRLRSFFHPEESPQGFDGSTSVALNIIPETGLDIFLDGELVGHQSPYVAKYLPAGPHRLLIESKGYQPFSLVFELAEQQALQFPVWLRTEQTDTGNQPKTQTAGGPALSSDIKPAMVAIETPLKIVPTIDSEPFQSPHALKRFWGSIAIGEFSVNYRYDQFGRLEIALPGYAARWVVNDKEVKAGSTHPFYEGRLVIIEERPQEPPRSVTLVRK